MLDAMGYASAHAELKTACLLRVAGLSRPAKARQIRHSVSTCCVPWCWRSVVSTCCSSVSCAGRWDKTCALTSNCWLGCTMAKANRKALAAGEQDHTA